MGDTGDPLTIDHTIMAMNWQDVMKSQRRNTFNALECERSALAVKKAEMAVRRMISAV